MSNTIDDMKTALRDAGVKVRSNATDEEVNIAFIELEAEREVAAIPEPEPAPVAFVAPSSGKETLDDILRRADPLKGDKDPWVIEWCENNLSPDDFQARYQGRKFSRV